MIDGGRGMVVRCHVVSEKQAGSNRWVRERERHHKPEKKGKTIV
jgi:hypothetical protein